ncbi:MAG: exodeoxyribonuclease VII small subunit [Saprospiraceae bacterium]|jgi:exodeoxyribonuclease VII small subunit|uniref:Exodeoxyribonuclease VII small subunit n=1 Tax=Candidatus Defluviibacterium haderslevense TaxID=2981993 RepID=A0A9D7SDM5_9BACT|nr:exodeoxyribonuclease VII small subunit [Candidatus Defluviibacterium haderslevense]MCC7025460.1 exodeoxyribonuclease VII small subunit [Saprospiraceae bacterium]MBK7245537.1 exodeoxyribonuclease VII small subunit [Candidatus Defluviibacterium haderslevense]MBK8244283.1 exodeoxyribonuclease VII small subunit [Candidatus Defluviibacterium haderslevense]MBK9719466.1 exodeoxyribonuclease VII small subunit [Candidatus Defluviibacterium haderslevense]
MAKSKIKLNYQEAFDMLNAIAERLEKGEIAIEEISSEIIKAKELMLYCETILRDIEKEISLDNK